MEFFDVGPEGMDIEEFNERVESLIRGGKMEVNADVLLRKIGQLVVTVDALVEENTALRNVIAQSQSEAGDAKKKNTPKQGKPKKEPE